MSTMVEQRTPSSQDFAIMRPPFDLRDGAIDPIRAMGSLLLPGNRVWLPNNPDATEFSTVLDKNLPPQIDSRHQPYFANFRVEGNKFPIVVKTYNGHNGANNWRKETAALEHARRAGLPTLTPRYLLKTRSGVAQLATDYIPDLFDLERRFMGDVPEGYEVDEVKLLARAAAALASMHTSDVAHGDAAPRNFAYRGLTAERPSPVMIDPETFTFSKEVTVSEMEELQKRDVDKLINESASLLAAKVAKESTQGGKAVKVSESARDMAKKSAADVIMPVYENVTGHSF